MDEAYGAEVVEGERRRGTSAGAPGGRDAAPARSFRSTVEPVLGTRLTLRIDADHPEDARAAEAAVLDEADRLEAVLTVHRADSPTSRWRRGELDDAPPELAAVLALAERWHRRTGGAFHPCLGAVGARWRRAAEEQRAPSASELRDLAAEVAGPLPFTVRDGAVIRSSDCAAVDVHGVAKGWVVDRLVDAALATSGVTGVLVDLGGDLRHLSDDADGEASSAWVAIEDPHAVADNARALDGRAPRRRRRRHERRWSARLADRRALVRAPGRSTHGLAAAGGPQRHRGGRQRSGCRCGRIRDGRCRRDPGARARRSRGHRRADQRRGPCPAQRDVAAHRHRAISASPPTGAAG